LPAEAACETGSAVRPETWPTETWPTEARTAEPSTAETFSVEAGTA
jgi:hypothetical protein